MPRLQPHDDPERSRKIHKLETGTTTPRHREDPGTEIQTHLRQRQPSRIQDPRVFSLHQPPVALRNASYSCSETFPPLANPPARADVVRSSRTSDLRVQCAHAQPGARGSVAAAKTRGRTYSAADLSGNSLTSSIGIGNPVRMVLSAGRTR